MGSEEYPGCCDIQFTVTQKSASTCEVHLVSLTTKPIWNSTAVVVQLCCAVDDKRDFCQNETEDVRMLCFKKVLSWVMYIGRAFLIKQLVSKQR